MCFTFLYVCLSINGWYEIHLNKDKLYSQFCIVFVFLVVFVAVCFSRGGCPWTRVYPGSERTPWAGHPLPQGGGAVMCYSTRYGLHSFPWRYVRRLLRWLWTIVISLWAITFIQVEGEKKTLVSFFITELSVGNPCCYLFKVAPCCRMYCVPYRCHTAH